jgi:ankyrin repeat protein
MKGKQQQNQLNKILFQAIKDNSLNRAVYALRIGADINGSDDLGNTAIHLAVSVKNKKAVEFCIENRCFINAQNKKGQTPLHLAITMNNLDIVKILVKNKNIDLEAKEKISNFTPLQVAEFLGVKQEIINLLKKGGN